MNPEFSDEKRLLLLQLMTLRSIAERKAREAAQKDEFETSPPEDEGKPEDIDGTFRWRLVSEDTSLYDWQKECLPIWLSKGRGTIKVATGGGKTLFALAAAEQLQNKYEPDLRLVIVVPTIPLMFQWYDELLRGNLSPSTIGMMGGGQELPPASSLRILICVLNSARDRLPEFVSKAKWADQMLLVVDECHRASADQAQRIFETKPKYTLGLSATPEQDTEDEGLPTDEAYEKSVVGQALGPIICEFTIKQSLDAGLLTPFEVWHVGLSLSPTEALEYDHLSRDITELRKALQGRHRSSKSTQGFLAWCQKQAKGGTPAAADAERFIGLASRRKRLLYQAAARIDIALGILTQSVADLDGRTIVFHESIEEIETLFLKSSEMSLPVVLEHSKLPESIRAENIDAFRRGFAKVIISAKSLVEGFNVPSADLGIIAASSGSVRQRIQSLGRMLRRKPGNRTARIIVLYIRNTQDETIYEKADWETIVGAERNRYFKWESTPTDEPWTNGLVEIFKPPRTYKPPSWEIDVDDFRMGDPYPGQTDGIDLRVDQSGNLRMDNAMLVPCPSHLVEEILKRNSHRRAHCAAAGHLIVRVDLSGSDEVDCRYLGRIKLPDETSANTIIRLRIRTSSGRRVIAMEEERKKGIVRYALGPNTKGTPEGGQARDRLLEWTREVEKDQGVSVIEIFWDNGSRYWLEIGGERIPYDGPLPPLEFAGHLIVRDDHLAFGEVDSRFQGRIKLPKVPVATGTVIPPLRIKNISGRREIVLEDRRNHIDRIALGPDKSTSFERGQSRDRLLEWIRRIEKERRFSIEEIFWNYGSCYWLEIGGERIPYSSPLAPLEFGE